MSSGLIHPRPRGAGIESDSRGDEEALQRGEEVEFPLGYLRRARHPHRKMRDWFLNDITTIYKNPYTVVHEMDDEGKALLPTIMLKAAARASPRRVENLSVYLPVPGSASSKVPIPGSFLSLSDGLGSQISTVLKIAHRSFRGNY